MALLGQDVMAKRRRDRGGGGGGGNSGNGRNDGGFYKEIIDILLMRNCMPCVRACLQQMRVAIDQKLVIKYTQTLFQTIDVAFRKHHGITLSEYVYNMLSRTKLSPAIALVTKYDPRASKETRYFKYFLMELVTDVLPNTATHLKHNTLYTSLKPEILKFLAKGKGDVSMLASAAVGYILKVYQIEGFDMPSVPCLVCKAFNDHCEETR